MTIKIKPIFLLLITFFGIISALTFMYSDVERPFFANNEYLLYMSGGFFIVLAVVFIFYMRSMLNVFGWFSWRAWIKLLWFPSTILGGYLIAYFVYAALLTPIYYFATVPDEVDLQIYSVEPSRGSKSCNHFLGVFVKEYERSIHRFCVNEKLYANASIGNVRAKVKRSPFGIFILEIQ